MTNNTYVKIYKFSAIAIIILSFIVVNFVLDTNVKNTADDINQISTNQDQEENDLSVIDFQESYDGSESSYTGELSEEYYYGSVIPDEEIGIAEITDGIQEITVNVSEYRFSPSIIVLQKGVKAKIKFNTEFLDECNEVIAFPEQGFVLGLYKGQLETRLLDADRDFIFECWMGMINAYVKVVDDINNVDMDAVKNDVIYYEPSEGESCH